jgi:hypothetical protein
MYFERCVDVDVDVDVNVGVDVDVVVDVAVDDFTAQTCRDDYIFLVCSDVGIDRIPIQYFSNCCVLPTAGLVGCDCMASQLGRYSQLNAAARDLITTPTLGTRLQCTRE